VIWFILLLLLPQRVDAAETRDIVFPVIGNVSYSDDFGAPRSGHTHEGNDLLGSKGQPLIAAVDGTIRYVAWPEPDYGYYVTITDEDGYRYNYLHINNDNPGTDDGNGGGIHAYAPYIEQSYPVKAGQLIGWMGDSGNAESTTPHLHFEIRDSGNTAIDPYTSLQAADHISTPVTADALDDELLPYGEFTGGAQIALGNLDTDAGIELVTGAGSGGGPQVRVFDRSGKAISTFFAYAEDFHGGIDVATGDVNGDGIDDVITAAGPGGGPHIRLFKTNGKEIRSFFAYEESFHGGVSVAAADVDGDGKVEIITAPKGSYSPQVKVFTRRGKLLYSFNAYGSSFTGGVDVSAQAATETSPGRIVTGAGPGGGPQVRIFSKSGYNVGSFYAYDQNYHGGVRVALSNGTLLTSPWSDGGPDIREFSIKGTYRDDVDVFERWWSGGYDVAIFEDVLAVSSAQGPRRTSVFRFD
jgi:hypothetical protein